MDSRLGSDPTIAAVAQTLADLLTKVPDLAERSFF
jgi:hypothetical protein